MTRRIITAREQVEMLLPWREADQDAGLRLAMPRADNYTGIPQGYHYKIEPPFAYMIPHGGNHESWASRIQWYPNGEVKNIQTQEDHMRKGLATHLFNETSKHVPELHHSEELTLQGREWAKSMYDWDPDVDDPYEDFIDMEGGYSGPSDDELAQIEEHSRQQALKRNQYWLDAYNHNRRLRGEDEVDKLPEDVRKMLGATAAREAASLNGWNSILDKPRDITAMTKRKPVYFALNPENPGHAMAYWGDRYEPIAEVKWTTKGKSGYSEDWEPTPEEQGSVDWVWSHPHARHKGITKSLLKWVRDNHEPKLHGSPDMTPQGKALSEALGYHVEDADWNRLQPVRGFDRPMNDAPYRMVDEDRAQWEADGRPGGYL